MKRFVTVRYAGTDSARRYILQRQDRKVWTGRQWSDAADDARLYHRVEDAHHDCRRLQARKYRGKPIRRFSCPLHVAVAGGGKYTLADLQDFLHRALNIFIDTAAEGDGLAGSYVVVSAKLAGLLENGAGGSGVNNCRPA